MKEILKSAAQRTMRLADEMVEVGMLATSFGFPVGKDLIRASYCISTVSVALDEGDIKELAELIEAWSDRSGFFEKVASKMEAEHPDMVRIAREQMARSREEGVSQEIKDVLSDLEL